VRGEVCPFTFVRAKLALEALPIGATLRVIVDHEPAVRTIPRSALEWGQEVLAVGPLPAEAPDITAPAAPAGHAAWVIDLRKRVR
jgi:TusA-related sulfurtransferase